MLRTLGMPSRHAKRLHSSRVRETAEETKQRAYREYGIAVIDVERDQMPWEFRVWLKQWAQNRFCSPDRRTK